MLKIEKKYNYLGISLNMHQQIQGTKQSNAPENQENWQLSRGIHNMHQRLTPIRQMVQVYKLNGKCKAQSDQITLKIDNHSI